MKHFIFPLLGGAGLLACSCAHRQADAMPDRPNIIYVFPDQFRNMALGFWDEEGFNEHVNFKADPVFTPNLNKFAGESLVLSSAMSNLSFEQPSSRQLADRNVSQ